MVTHLSSLHKRISQSNFSFRSRKRQNELRRALHKFQCIYWNKHANKINVTIGTSSLSGVWEERISKFGICIKFRVAATWHGPGWVNSVQKCLSRRQPSEIPSVVAPNSFPESPALIHSHLHKINIVHLSDASLFFALSTYLQRGGESLKI